MARSFPFESPMLSVVHRPTMLLSGVIAGILIGDPSRDVPVPSCFAVQAVAWLTPSASLPTAIDPAAVACARRNLAHLGGRVYQGDLFRPLPVALLGSVDVLVINAPYVPTYEVALMPPEARLHEPLVALDGGGDGLDGHRRVAATAAQWLAPKGMLFAECSDRQADKLRAIYERAGVHALLSAT